MTLEEIKKNAPKGQCGNCGEKDTHVELHHIVPKSRGGTDAPSNLQLLCVSCHELAHDVRFRGESGLVSQGIQSKVKRNKSLEKWLEDNENEIHRLIMDFRDEYDSDILTDLFYFNAVSIEQFYHWLQTGQNLERSNYGDLPRMTMDLFQCGDYDIKPLP